MLSRALTRRRIVPNVQALRGAQEVVPTSTERTNDVNNKPVVSETAWCSRRAVSRCNAVQPPQPNILHWNETETPVVVSSKDDTVAIPATKNGPDIAVAHHIRVDEDNNDNDSWLASVMAILPSHSAEDFQAERERLCMLELEVATKKCVVAEPVLTDLTAARTEAHPMAPRRPSPQARRSHSLQVKKSSKKKKTSLTSNTRRKPLQTLQLGSSTQREVDGSMEEERRPPLHGGIMENLPLLSATNLRHQPQAIAIVRLLEDQADAELELFVRNETGYHGTIAIVESIPELFAPLHRFTTRLLLLRQQRQNVGAS